LGEGTEGEEPNRQEQGEETYLFHDG
jgi:hypothetical protein